MQTVTMPQQGISAINSPLVIPSLARNLLSRLFTSICATAASPPLVIVTEAPEQSFPCEIHRRAVERPMHLQFQASESRSTERR